MRLLAGDVGGTKTLLRAVENDVTLREARFESAAYPTFESLVDDFLKNVSGAIDAACFAVAGPVYGGRAEVTNVGWHIDEKNFAIPQVRVINDFYAVALGVPLLDAADLLSLHGGTRDRSSPMAVLGAGTGLGEAMIVHGEVVATEGGHKDFAPQDEEQSRLFLWLNERHGHVSWERVVSGMGLTNIFAFLGGGDDVDPSRIAELADAGDPRAIHAFEIFVDAYGAEAGNMALQALTRGGVFLAGGIAAKNVPRFTDGRFVEAFLRKGRFRALLETIPVDLIVNEEVGLIGAMEAARRLIR